MSNTEHGTADYAAQLHSGRLSWDRIIEWTAVMFVTFLCFGAVTLLRWIERATQHHKWTLAFVAVASIHLGVDAALILFLLRCLYRWVRGRSLFHTDGSPSDA